ncbi:hypothetical protein [Actinomadura litoris]|uniref:hypothetical protein n=1 Tax=Actinomadura litoris TaxID=2678616 RepID=UPI001FA803FF|nr:hypothetical protein [Actinomadura litoris]
MEDEFAGKDREDFLDLTLLTYEAVRSVLKMLPVAIAMPKLQVEDAKSVSAACEALRRARDELIDVQPIPATLAALITEGALEALQCLLMVTHTEGRDLPGWHAELWFRSTNRAKIMCIRSEIALTAIKEETNRLE